MSSYCKEKCLQCDFPWHPEKTWDAVYYGHIECLKYAHEHGCPWHPATTRDAARNGHLECLKYAHEHGCPWHPHTTKAAACRGHLECLKYIYEHCGDIATWEDSCLGNNFDTFPEECQNFLKSVKEEWIAKRNIPGINIKG